MSTLLERVSAGALPRHVAIIMDGNGRWAEARGLPRTAGHQAGALAAERLIRFAGTRLPIPYLTLFAFSSENWARPQAEVAFLMNLLADFLRARLAEFVEAGVRLRVIGDLERLPASLPKAGCVPPPVTDSRQQFSRGTSAGHVAQLGHHRALAHAEKLIQIQLRQADGADGQIEGGPDAGVDLP